MFTRLRVAFAITLLFSVLFASLASAKGGFDFIVIAGPNLKEEVHSSDPALSEDFFAFADFYRSKTQAPADPSAGYEITRYYVDGARAIAFDRLHYYPDSGLVFYDGIVNGESEYDGEWYTARPEVQAVFESALLGQKLPGAGSNQALPGALLRAPWTRVIAILAALAVICLFVFRSRRSPAR